ncbi:MAG: PAS domain S-box protein [Alphaproteobacteria bacterium]
MKADGKSKTQEKEALRQRAQERLCQSVRDCHALPKESILDLMHELEVHQVELEIQNEELRRANSEVDASRQRYADLYDFAPIAYVTLDHQGVICEANLTATKLLGVEREHLLHRGLHLFVVKGSQEIFNEFLGRVFDDDGQHSCELELRRNQGKPLNQGTPLNVCVLTSPRRDSDRDSVFCQMALIDITERKRSETLIYREQLWLRSLIETTQDAFVSIDRQGHIVEFNPAGEKIFGYQKNEIVGQKVNILMPEPYASEHDDHIARYKKTGKPHAIGRIRTVTAKRKNGEPFPMELSVTEIPMNDGARYAALMRDISDRVKLQEQLIESQRLAAIGATAAKFAHEVGNPLNNIYMTIQLLSRRLEQAGVTDEKSLGTFQTIVKEIKRLNSLLGDFRSLYRDDRYNLQPVSIAQVVRHLLDVEEKGYASQGVRFECLIDADLPLVIADGDRLEQALLNLCKNAVEAMPEGGTLTVRVAMQGTDTVIEVSDTGIGVPEGIDIWEPFKTTKSLGTGLGLVIVRQIIVAHRGTITYESEVGKGTTFRLNLPLRRAE